jgi:hypothetical protein
VTQGVAGGGLPTTYDNWKNNGPTKTNFCAAAVLRLVVPLLFLSLSIEQDFPEQRG